MGARFIVIWQFGRIFSRRELRQKHAQTWHNLNHNATHFANHPKRRRRRRRWTDCKRQFEKRILFKLNAILPKKNIHIYFYANAKRGKSNVTLRCLYCKLEWMVFGIDDKSKRTHTLCIVGSFDWYNRSLHIHRERKRCELFVAPIRFDLVWLFRFIGLYFAWLVAWLQSSLCLSPLLPLCLCFLV